MKIDLHVHTNSFDSVGMSPARLVDRAHKIGLDGFAATNHNSAEAAEECVAYGRKVGFPVFRGAELSTDRGHLLVYGLDHDDWDPKMASGLPPAERVLARLDRTKVAVFLAHPFFDVFHPTREMLLEFLPKVDGVETINGSKLIVNEMLAQRMKGVELRGIGGSDAHEPGRLGEAYTLFDRRIESDRELVEALRHGSYTAVLAPRRRGLLGLLGLRRG